MNVSFNIATTSPATLRTGDEFYGNIDDGRRDNIAGRHTYVCPLDHIPVLDGTYDFILCTEVLEHLPCPIAALKELRRVLKTSGILFVSVPQGYGIHGGAL